MSHPNHNEIIPADSGTQDQATDTVGRPAPEPAADLSALLKKAEDEALELKDAYLRSRAELENVRKQGQNDVAKAYRYAIEKFAQELLEVKDSLESTLKAENVAPDALRAGVELTLKQLSAAFDKAQIKEIAATQTKFDPHLHQAMTTVDSDLPPNTVVTVYQKGYLLNDRVLRPALVAVSKAREAAS